MSIRLLEETKTPLVRLPTALFVENFTENPPYTQNKQIRHVCFFSGKHFSRVRRVFFQQPSPRHLAKKNRAESIPRVRFRWNGRNFHHRTLWVTARSNVLGRNRFRFTPTWCAARRFLNSIRHPFFFGRFVYGGTWNCYKLLTVSGWLIYCRVNWSCGFFGEFLAILGMFGRSVLRCHRLRLPRWHHETCDGYTQGSYSSTQVAKKYQLLLKAFLLTNIRLLAVLFFRWRCC